MGSERRKYSERQGPSDPAWRVVIAIGPSRLVALHVMTLAAAGMACVLLSGLDTLLAAGACGALVVAAVAALRREGFRAGRGATRRLVVDLSGRVESSGATGVKASGVLAPGSFVAPWLTIVHWRPDGARFARTVLVPPDAVDADAFRRLRVLLRWGYGSSSAPKVPVIQFRSSARSTR